MAKDYVSLAKDYVSLAKEILRLVGGEDNVTHFEHCSTRLHFTIADSAKVEKEKIKAPLHCSTKESFMVL